MCTQFLPCSRYFACTCWKLGICSICLWEGYQQKLVVLAATVILLLFVSQTILPDFADSVANATLRQGLSISDCHFLVFAAPMCATSCGMLEEHARATRTSGVKLPCSFCKLATFCVSYFLFSISSSRLTFFLIHFYLFLSVLSQILGTLLFFAR